MTILGDIRGKAPMVLDHIVLLGFLFCKVYGRHWNSMVKSCENDTVWLRIEIVPILWPSSVKHTHVFHFAYSTSAIFTKKLAPVMFGSYQKSYQYNFWYSKHLPTTQKQIWVWRHQKGCKAASRQIFKVFTQSFTNDFWLRVPKRFWDSTTYWSDKQ